MTPIRTIGAIIALLVLLILFGSVYTVQEGQQAMLLQLGNIVTNKKTNMPYITGPGMHFKWPFVNSVQIFDTRLQTLDIKSSRIVTAEQKRFNCRLLCKMAYYEFAALFYPHRRQCQSSKFIT